MTDEGAAGGGEGFVDVVAAAVVLLLLRASKRPLTEGSHVGLYRSSRLQHSVAGVHVELASAFRQLLPVQSGPLWMLCSIGIEGCLPPVRYPPSP